jgi:hypothetical protein
MPSAEKIALIAIVLALPVVLPSTLAKLGGSRFTGKRHKSGFITRVAIVSYSLAIAVAFFISTALRTFASSIVTGHEPVVPIYNFLAAHELTITLCILILGAIGTSMIMFPKQSSQTGTPQNPG